MSEHEQQQVPARNKWLRLSVRLLKTKIEPNTVLTQEDNQTNVKLGKGAIRLLKVSIHRLIDTSVPRNLPTPSPSACTKNAVNALSVAV